MGRWTIPIGAAVAWLLFTIIGVATRGSVWFILQLVAFLVASFTVVVAIAGAARERRAKRDEELELLREIAEQGRAGSAEA